MDHRSKPRRNFLGQARHCSIADQISLWSISRYASHSHEVLLSALKCMAHTLFDMMSAKTLAVNVLHTAAGASGEHSRVSNKPAVPKLNLNATPGRPSGSTRDSLESAKAGFKPGLEGATSSKKSQILNSRV